MSKVAVLRFGFAAIHYSGLAKFLSSRTSGLGHIFCLHHVRPQRVAPQSFAPNSHLEISPEFLDQLIITMRRKNIDLVGLDEAMHRLKVNGRTPRRFAVFTLDDGYRDNFIHAQPVFETHNCPFTVYVASKIAEGTCELWWRLLEAVIAKSNHISANIAGEVFDLSTVDVASKYAAWSRIAPKLQAMDEYAQRITIRKMCAECNVDWQAVCREAAMNWDEIRAMAKHPLATIGAHTLNHYNLSKLPAVDAEKEIRESKTQIENMLGRSVKHFAYPYGNVDAAGQREFNMCNDLGFDTAVVTRLGALWPEHINHPHALPRVMVSSRYQTHAAVESLISGVPAVLANKLRRLNVA